MFSVKITPLILSHTLTPSVVLWVNCLIFDAMGEGEYETAHTRIASRATAYSF